MAIVDDYYNHPHVAAQIFPNYETAVRDSVRDNLGGAGLGYLSASVDDLQALVEQQRIEMEKQLRSMRLILAFATLAGVGGALIGISLYLRRT